VSERAQGQAERLVTRQEGKQGPQVSRASRLMPFGRGFDPLSSRGLRPPGAAAPPLGLTPRMSFASMCSALVFERQPY
jgi:hypothetical protein